MAANNRALIHMNWLNFIIAVVVISASGCGGSTPRSVIVNESERDIVSKINRHLNEHDFAAVAKLLKEHIPTGALSQQMLFGLTYSNAEDAEVLATFIHSGVDINLADPDERNGGSRILDEVVGCGYTDAVRWLLERGALVNHEREGKPYCMALVNSVIGGEADANLEIVRLLVEHGAEINSICPSGHNPLSFAIIYKHRQIESYLREHGAVLPPLYTDDRLPVSAFESHLEAHLGKVTKLNVSAETPTEVNLSFYVVTMKGGKALVTHGMSEHLLPVDRQTEPPYVELIIYLPAQWPLDPKSLADSAHSWPISWLRRIASVPVSEKRGMGGLHALFLNDPPDHTIANTNFVGFLALAEMESGIPVYDDGRPEGATVFYSLFPIFAEEAAIYSKMGAAELVKRFEKYKIKPIIDPGRKNVGLDK